MAQTRQEQDRRTAVLPGRRCGGRRGLGLGPIERRNIHRQRLSARRRDLAGAEGGRLRCLRRRRGQSGGQGGRRAVPDRRPRLPCPSRPGGGQYRCGRGETRQCRRRNAIATRADPAGRGATSARRGRTQPGDTGVRPPARTHPQQFRQPGRSRPERRGALQGRGRRGRSSRDGRGAGTAHRGAGDAARSGRCRVEQARAARDLAQIDLDNTVVHAPVSGVVGNRQVRIGRLVAPGVSLLDIVPVDDLWVVANFKETQIERIRPGQRVRITVDGYPNEAMEGTVDSFAPGSGSAFSLLPSDNATGNFVRVVQRVPVKIRFVGKPLQGRLVPGLSARVEVDLASGPAGARTASRFRRPSRHPAPDRPRHEGPRTMIAAPLTSRPSTTVRRSRTAAALDLVEWLVGDECHGLDDAGLAAELGRRIARHRHAGRPADAASSRTPPGALWAQCRLGAGRSGRDCREALRHRIHAGLLLRPAAPVMRTRRPLCLRLDGG